MIGGPRGHISNDLTIEELTALQAAGKLPADYAAVMVPAMQLQVAPGRDERGRAVAVFQVVCAIPEETLTFPTGGLLAANGQTAYTDKAQRAVPVAPMIRIIVDRQYLSARVRDDLDAQAAGLPPLPALRRDTPPDNDAM